MNFPVTATTYLLRNDKLYRTYMTPLMDLTGIVLLLGTSPTLIRTHAMNNGMGSLALFTIMSLNSLWVIET
jgi:hypothetical protein